MVNTSEYMHTREKIDNYIKKYYHKDSRLIRFLTLFAGLDDIVFFREMAELFEKSEKLKSEEEIKKYFNILEKSIIYRFKLAKKSNNFEDKLKYFFQIRTLLVFADYQIDHGALNKNVLDKVISKYPDYLSALARCDKENLSKGVSKYLHYDAEIGDKKDSSLAEYLLLKKSQDRFHLLNKFIKAEQVFSADEINFNAYKNVQKDVRIPFISGVDYTYIDRMLKKNNDDTEYMYNVLLTGLYPQYLKGKVSDLTLETLMNRAGVDSHYNSFSEVKVFKGVCASAGEVKAKAIKVEDVEDLKKIEKGDIVVLSSYPYDYMQYLLKVGGVISTSGGILSHLAIVARELNIPCIVSCEDDVLSSVHNGQLLKLDAKNGKVYTYEKQASVEREIQEQK